MNPNRSFRRVSIALAAIVLCASLLGLAGRSEAASDCPGTFKVLHNDHIGAASFPKGSYTMTILTSNPSFTCSVASSKFARFLQDYDGVLGKGWKVKAIANGKANFLKNGSPQFGVRKASGPTPGPAPGPLPPTPSGLVCPGTFSVLHNDRIGPLSFPKGKYKLIIPKGSVVPCKTAAKNFARFLAIPSGQLPDGWGLKQENAVFYKKDNPVRKKFRVDPM